VKENRTLRTDPSQAPFETPFETQGRRGKNGKPFEAQGKKVRHPPDNQAGKTQTARASSGRMRLIAGTRSLPISDFDTKLPSPNSRAKVAASSGV
jgi:hypothetical protein